MEHISFITDIRVIVDTVRAFLDRSDNGAVLNTFDDFDVHRRKQWETGEGDSRE